jgi:hypothetical protein
MDIPLILLKRNTMKKTVCSLGLATLLLNSGCIKTKVTSSASTTYKGVILYSICTQTVIQTLGPNYLGINNWVDGNDTNHPVYNHVFRMQNGCMGVGQKGDTIIFKVIPPQVQNCMACMIYIDCPDTLIPIQLANTL